MPHTDANARLRELAGQGRRCTERGCNFARHKLGGRCAAHARRWELTGHSDGRSIRAGEIKYHRQLAARYIKAHRAHPAVVAGLDWLTTLLARAAKADLAPLKGGRARTEAPGRRVERWLASMHRKGVSAEECLSVVVAMYLHRERMGTEYRDDRHWRHQLAMRFMRLRGGFEVRPAVGRAYQRSEPVSSRMREALWPRLAAGVGLLAFMIARRLAEALEPPPPTYRETIAAHPLP